MLIVFTPSVLYSWNRMPWRNLQAIVLCCITEKNNADVKSASFLFLLLPKMYGWLEYRRVEDGWAAHTGLRYDSSIDRFFSLLFGSRSLSLYNTPDTHTNSRGHNSSLPPTQCTWSCFLLTCHPRNLHGIYAENTCVLFTLSTRCISYYFRSIKVRLPPLYRQTQRGLQVSIQHLPWDFARTPLLWKLFWFFLRIFSISGWIRLWSRAL